MKLERELMFFHKSNTNNQREDDDKNSELKKIQISVKFPLNVERTEV